MVVTTDCYLFGLKTTQYFLFDAHNFGIQSQGQFSGPNLAQGPQVDSHCYTVVNI